jgi:hypothetical protein
MIELLMFLSLAGSQTQPASQTPVTTCVWPNKCAVEVAQVQPCVWPNRCAAPELKNEAEQFQPCVWPNKCSVEPRIAQFKPCVWPNRCATTHA